MTHSPNPRITNLAIASALSAILVVSLAACGKAPETGSAASQSTTVGTEIDDTVITTRVKAALMADSSINSFDFKVDTRKGEVLLSGFVDSQAQLDLAISMVRAVEGVESIQNNVQIKDGNATVGNKLDDGIITGKVKAALLGDRNIQSLDIQVVTRIDVVQLSGFVNTQQEMDLALQIAAETEGVRSVSNEMKLKQ